MSLPQTPLLRRVVNLEVYFSPAHLKDPHDWDWEHIMTLHHATFRVLHINDATISAGQLFNLSELHDLIFNNTIAERPRSLLHNDNPILPVRVVTMSLAKRIRELDPEENFFHVELFPPSPHADLWSSAAWKESLSKRLKNNRELQDLHKNSPLARREAIISELTLALRQRLPNVTATDARKFALFYLAMPASDQILTALGISDAILAAMARLRKELTPEELTSVESTTHPTGTPDAPDITSNHQ